MSKKYGVSSTGLIAPIIRKGDDLCQIVCDTVLNAIDNIEDKDIIGITESVVARAQGNYVTVDEVAEDIKKKFNNPVRLCVYKPIYSRNRFAMILKAIARAVRDEVLIFMPHIDEVGNVLRNHPFTGLNYDDYYKSIVETEGKKCEILNVNEEAIGKYPLDCILDCQIHKQNFTMNLARICDDKCEYGLYGSNKSSEEVLKLFPDTVKAKQLVQNIQAYIYRKTGKKVEVMVYGDGCFKDPVGGIWEWADPIVSPAYTDGLEGTPNEMKLKYLIDNDFSSIFSQDELERAIKSKIRNKDNNLVGQMTSQGTTPRRYTDLLGSLMDLTSGSGDKGTPIIYVKRYFDNLGSE